MVKNTVGGKKGKMMANKSGGNSSGKDLRMIEFPDIEIMVCVTKVFGGGLFEVVNNSGGKYTAFLRGKMKGHNKRHNLVSLFSILLVAKRIDTDPTKCDILFVYDAHDIQFLALNPMLNIGNLLSLHNNHIISTGSSCIEDDLFISGDNNTTTASTMTIVNDNNPDSNNDSNDIDFNCI